MFIDSNIQEDLYPKDFLISLEKPNEYFGSEELFGREAVNGSIGFEGLPVIRSISVEDLAVLNPQKSANNQEKEPADLMVPSLQNAIVRSANNFIKKHKKNYCKYFFLC